MSQNDVKVGIIGGNFGKYLASISPYPTLVYDVEPSKRQVTLKELLYWATHIVVATPNSTHFELGMSSLCAGKHTMILKPFVLSRQEVKELFHVSELHHANLRAGFNQRYRREWEGIDPATVKQVTCVWVQFKENFPVRSGFNNIKYDIGSHCVDLAMRFLPSSLTNARTELFNDSVGSSIYHVTGVYGKCYIRTEAHVKNRSELDHLTMRIIYIEEGESKEALVQEAGPVNTWQDEYTFRRMLTDFVESNVSDDKDYLINLCEFLSGS